jgi:hypothetical protein
MFAAAARGKAAPVSTAIAGLDRVNRCAAAPSNPGGRYFDRDADLQGLDVVPNAAHIRMRCTQNPGKGHGRFAFEGLARYVSTSLDVDLPRPQFSPPYCEFWDKFRIHHLPLRPLFRALVIRLFEAHAPACHTNEQNQA